MSDIPSIILNLAERSKIKFNYMCGQAYFDPEKRAKFWEKAIEEASKELKKDHAKSLQAFKLHAGN